MVLLVRDTELQGNNIKIKKGGVFMDTLKTALTTAFTGVKTDTLDIMGVALPAALGIVSVVMAVKIGINFFKSVAQA